MKISCKWKSPHVLYISIYPHPQVGCDTRSTFKQSFTGLNLEFFFSKTGCHTEFKEYSLLYNLPIVRGKIVECIPFPSCEMQTA